MQHYLCTTISTASIWDPWLILMASSAHVFEMWIILSAWVLVNHFIWFTLLRRWIHEPYIQLIQLVHNSTIVLLNNPNPRGWKPWLVRTLEVLKTFPFLFFGFYIGSFLAIIQVFRSKYGGGIQSWTQLRASSNSNSLKPGALHFFPMLYIYIYIIGVLFQNHPPL